MNTFRRYVPALFALLLLGCSVDVEVPGESTVTEVKQRTLERLETLVEAIESGQDSGHRFNRNLGHFAGNLNQMRGTLRLTGAGNEENLRRLDEAYYHIAGLAGGGPEKPAHLEAGETPLIQPGDLQTLLPQVRDAVEAIPDSDLRPPPKTAR